MISLILIATIVSVTLYFLPTILSIIYSSGFNKKTFMIFVINMFFGWTILVWIVLLIWAVSDNTDNKKLTSDVLSDISLRDLKRAKEKLDLDIITLSEYDEIKRNLSKLIK